MFTFKTDQGNQNERRFRLGIVSVAQNFKEHQEEQARKGNSFNPSMYSSNARKRAFSVSEISPDQTKKKPFEEFLDCYRELKSNLNLQEENEVLRLGYASDYRKNLKERDVLSFLNKVKYFAVENKFDQQSTDVQRHLILSLKLFHNFLAKKVEFEEKKNAEDTNPKELKQFEKNYHAAAKDAIKALEKLEYAAKPACQKAFEIICGIIGFIVGAIVVGLLSHFAFGGPFSPTGYIGAIIGFAGGGLVGFAKGAAIGAALFALGTSYMASAFGGFCAGRKGTHVWQTNYETGKFMKLSSHKFFKADPETDPYIICRDMVKLGIKIIKENEKTYISSHAKQGNLQPVLSEERIDLAL